MDALYGIARVSVTGEAPSGEIKIQRQWLSDTQKNCLGKKEPLPCISAAYDDRNDELAVEALFGAHGDAMGQLRSLPSGSAETPNPSVADKNMIADRRKAADLYEAIYQYAKASSTASRITNVVPLIAPLFRAIKGQPWDTPISGQRSPEDALASDETFAAFLAVASVSIGSADIVLPCAALVRRPGLIGLLKSYYGGAIDGHLAGTTCATATTAIPAFDALSTAAMEAQTVCRGTIRFSLFRTTERVLTAARLHRIDVLRSDVFSPEHPAAASNLAVPTPEAEDFMSRHRSLMHEAQQELSAYYSSAFHVFPGNAQVDAKLAIARAMQAIYGGCE